MRRATRRMAAPADGPLLAGIMGHNLCLDIFGGPSPEEAAAGLTAHGEASVAPYAIEANGSVVIARADLPHAGLSVERRLELRRSTVEITETVDEPDGVRSADRLDPARHARTAVSQERRDRVPRIGNPFESVRRRVRTSGLSRSRRRLRLATCTASDGGGTVDLRRFTDAPASSAYTAHLMDQSRAEAFFVGLRSGSPARVRLRQWRRADFPWMGIWEENRSRPASPWNGREITRGMEFGVSPFPETRRADDRARAPVRHTDVSLDPGAQPGDRRVPNRGVAGHAGTRCASVEPPRVFCGAKRLATSGCLRYGAPP